MTISFSLGNKDISTPRIVIEGNTYILSYPCNSSSPCTYYQAFLHQGKYIFEVWGGEGGYYGGLGGYSKGIINLNRGHLFYFFIGSKGSEMDLVYGPSELSFNGGGSGFSAQNTNEANPNRSCGSGGGSTDVRIDSPSLNHRIIVAGGGGGGARSGSVSYFGGHGGGESGFSGDDRRSDPGFGGTQYLGGIQYIPGSFGHGGNGNSDGTSGGGGGGWFGGGAGKPGTSSTGGGGSGYVLTDTSHKPEGYIYDPSHYLSDSIILSGNDIFPPCSISINQNNETGHTGDGCVRITILGRFLPVHNTIPCHPIMPFLANLLTMFNIQIYLS